jgi:MFS family permease
VPIGALLIEGAMMEWSALLMREWKGASPFVTALTFSVFALAMAATRLAGDRLAEQFGPRPVILRSGLVMAVGIVGFGLAPGLWMSIPAAALVGIGCGNIYPLTMSMVGQVPGPRPERNVATLALVAFTAFLVGPPLIGALAHAVGLPAALALLAPLGLAPLVLLRRRARAAQPQ